MFQLGQVPGDVAARLPSSGLAIRCSDLQLMTGEYRRVCRKRANGGGTFVQSDIFRAG
jgi:hypothetical protein